ncbi:MAG: DNA recombination protein RmuC [Deltaproteobacteria bacterium]|nr:DNA recombination protein RmuC [Deltaproteobacteria bacterium]
MWIAVILSLIIGFFLGIGTVLVLRIQHLKTAREVFGQLSLEALSKSSEEFLKLAKTKLGTEREFASKELDTKKELIDQQLHRISSELEKVTKVARELEKDRVEKFGELTNHLKRAGEQTAQLIQTTNVLKEALAGTKARGQWGERMAEDVLRFAGFLEHVNYRKETSSGESSTRPDFTFILPQDRTVNMDVKFPLDNYLRFLEAPSELEKEKHKKDFLRDIRAKLKEVTSRNYINPEENTLDYVLLFIPNEQIYSFIHEQERSILDEALQNKVILCSPITLFVVLAIIRQGVENFALAKASNEILSSLGAFKKQWEKFVEKLDLLGKRLNDAQTEYESLVTTRKRQLDKPLNRLETLRMEKGLPLHVDFEGDGNPAFLAQEERIND